MKRKTADTATLQMGLQKPDHISYSQIVTYLQCPHLWALTRIFGVKQPHTQPLTFGVLMHEALYRCWKNFSVGGVVDAETIIEIWRSVCNDPKLIYPALPLDAYREGEMMLLDAILSEKVSFAETLFAEYEFRVKFGDAVVVGRIDKVDDMGSGWYRLTDYKSGMQMPSTDNMANDLELALYAAAWREIIGDPEMCIAVRIHNVRWNIYEERQVMPDEMDNIIRYVGDIWHRIQTSEGFPPLPGDGCLAYGGCWAASMCSRRKLSSLRIGETDMDISAMSNDEILDLYHTMEMWLPKLRKVLRERVVESGDISLEDGRKIELKGTITRRENPGALADFLDTFRMYVTDPEELLRINGRNTEKAVDAIADNIRGDNSIAIEERASLLETLGLMAGMLQVEVPGTPRITVSGTMGIDNSEEE